MIDQMLNKQIPELNFLLSEVERRYGRRVSTSTDFEALSVVIEHDIGEHISATTLKRLWGYVSNTSAPRESTLDVLARYIGENSFSSFCEKLRREHGNESAFVSAKFVSVKSLQVGSEVTIGWHPNRTVVLYYEGDYRFTVKESHNSQLQEGDKFELASFILGYPLYIASMVRAGVQMPPYIAGMHSGLSCLNVSEPKGGQLR